MKTTLTLLLLSLSVTLYSQPSLADSLNLNLPKKKERKKEIYIGFYKPFFNATTKMTWSAVEYSDLAVDSTYYSYQSYRNHKVKIKGTRGMTIGYNRRMKLTDKIHFKTGLGMNIFGMSYEKSFTDDSIRIIRRYKRVTASIPSEIESTIVNENIYGLNNHQGPYIVSSPFNFFVASVQIPIGGEILVSQKLIIGGGVNYNFVFEGSVYSYYLNQGNSFYDYVNTDLINRTYTTVDLHIKYNVYKNFFFELNGTFVGGVFNKYRSFNDEFFEGVDAIYGYNLGVRFGYNY